MPEAPASAAFGPPFGRGATRRALRSATRAAAWATARAAVALTVAGLVAIWAPDPAAAQAREFKTALGVTMRFIPAPSLDCAALGEKLNEIDATGYRGKSPTPLDTMDQPLFIYEHKVASALYTRCARDMGAPDVTRAMTRGFRN